MGSPLQQSTAVDLLNPLDDQERVQAILAKLEGPNMITVTVQELKILRRYIYLRERQAMKAANRRKTLRNLHRIHTATLWENRYLRQRGLWAYLKQFLGW